MYKVNHKIYLVMLILFTFLTIMISSCAENDADREAIPDKASLDQIMGSEKLARLVAAEFTFNANLNVGALTTGSVTGTSIEVKWDANSNADDYLLLKWDFSQDGWVTDLSQWILASGSGHVDTGLTPSMLYRYVLLPLNRTTNEYGFSNGTVDATTSTTVSLPFSFSGTGATGVATANATVTITGADGTPLTQSTTTGTDGSYAVTIDPGPTFPLKITSTANGVSQTNWATSSTSTIVNLNPITTAAANSVTVNCGVGSTGCSAALTSTGQSILDTVLGGGVTFASFSSSTFTARTSATDFIQTASVVDVLLDTLGELAATNGTALSTLLTTQTTPLLENDTFLINAAENLALVDTTEAVSTIITGGTKAQALDSIAASIRPVIAAIDTKKVAVSTVRGIGAAIAAALPSSTLTSTQLQNHANNVTLLVSTSVLSLVQSTSAATLSEAELVTLAETLGNSAGTALQSSNLTGSSFTAAQVATDLSSLTDSINTIGVAVLSDATTISTTTSTTTTSTTTTSTTTTLPNPLNNRSLFPILWTEINSAVVKTQFETEAEFSVRKSLYFSSVENKTFYFDLSFPDTKAEYYSLGVPRVPNGRSGGLKTYNIDSLSWDISSSFLVPEEAEEGVPLNINGATQSEGIYRFLMVADNSGAVSLGIVETGGTRLGGIAFSIPMSRDLAQSVSEEIVVQYGFKIKDREFITYSESGYSSLYKTGLFTYGVLSELVSIQLYNFVTGEVYWSVGG